MNHDEFNAWGWGGEGGGEGGRGWGVTLLWASILTWLVYRQTLWRPFYMRGIHMHKYTCTFTRYIIRDICMAAWDELPGKFVSASSRYCNVKEGDKPIG